MALCMSDFQENKEDILNPDIIKEKIAKDIGKKVRVTVYGLRNKTCLYDGSIKGIYPNIFTIYDGTNEKSFNYRDIITGDIKIKYM